MTATKKTAPDSANVSAGKPKAAGGVWTAPLGTPLPTDARTALKAPFQSLGYVSEDGLTNTVENDTEDIKEWGGDTVLKISTSRTETFSHKFIETNLLVMQEVYGAENVTGDLETGLTVLHNARELPRRAYVYEILLSGGRVKRIVVPNAQITEIGEIVYQAGEPIGYEVTVTAYPDEQGNTAYEYISKIA